MDHGDLEHHLCVGRQPTMVTLNTISKETNGFAGMSGDIPDTGELEHQTKEKSSESSVA